MKKSRIISILVCAVMVLSLVLAGCGAKSNSADAPATATSTAESNDANAPADDKVTISFWKAPHSESEADFWKPILAKFMEENPNITVEHLVTPWDTWTEKYTAAFAGGTPPDVSYMTEWFPKFADANQLADLSKYVTDDSKKLIGKSNWDYATYKGKLIGMPFLAVDSVVFYNKDIFEKEGLSIPKTWDEFLAALKQCTKDLDGDGKTDQWGTSFYFKPEISIHQMIPFAIGAGQTYLNADEKELGFANADGIKAIKFATDLVIKEKVAPSIDALADPAQIKGLFYNGKMAMFIDQISMGSDIKTNAPDLKFGAFMVPSGPASDAFAAQANYGGLGILSIAENSKNKDAAWKLIDFISKPENASMYLSKVNFLSPIEATNKVMYPDDEIMQVASQATQYMVNYPVNSNWKEIDTTLKTMLEEILRETKTAEQAVMDANQKAKDILK